MNVFHSFANPGRFSRLSHTLLPWTLTLGMLVMALGLAWSLILSPPDYQQGEHVRIMYIHVPAAWLSLGIYASMGMAAFCSLVWRHALADVYVQAAAPLGLCFTAICLITGSLWGQPTWGTWWVWDARLTSVLVLFFLYLGVIALVHGFYNPARGAKAASFLSLIGLINLPIIKFSVEWWNTLHQPASLLRRGGSALDSSMLEPLLVMGVAFILLFCSLALIRMRTLLIQRRVNVMLQGVRT